MMAGGIHSNRWRDYLRDIHRVLRPGGWCQMVEIYFNAQSDNGTLTQSRPQGANADAKLDAKCWIRLGGNPNDPSPDLRMTSQEFQVLVAQARSEADNPAFRVSSLPPKQSSFFRVGMPTNIRATLGGSS
ncbi:hypothetical protein CPAR01_16401 [Colletotrichum paranaense]|uniref:Methyltransferase n=2 Tax=Colletotrichum acutatum species complex TaxID=2707335 RepID=A0AAI9YQ50_9PEZI|nr:uncharacterized protein CCOS01_11859 [Colletotrichum costaricense]XP_060340559.1 uncharacterized protein CPAR01_16401 [Colletotrichum paranaense]KAK1516082.1 hypothetical protein CPAR01_16401 [Colletotrichum paranaense]KAK1519039.1 hypothetical protein CCOS01_11859 [Colletotrichum costaricense]